MNQSQTKLRYFFLVKADYPGQPNNVGDNDFCIAGVNVQTRRNGDIAAKTCVTSPIKRFLRDTNGKISHAITQSGTCYALGEELSVENLTGTVEWELAIMKKLCGKGVVRMTEINDRL